MVSILKDCTCRLISVFKGLTYFLWTPYIIIKFYVLISELTIKSLSPDQV